MNTNDTPAHIAFHLDNIGLDLTPTELNIVTKMAMRNDATGDDALNAAIRHADIITRSRTRAFGYTR